MEINENSVMDAISLALKAACPFAAVECGRVTQDFTPPAFFVRELSGGQRGQIGLAYGAGDVARSARHHRAPIYEVAYFPAAALEDAQAEECRAMKELLLDVLERVKTPQGVLLGGRNMEGAAPDNVLVMTVTYPHNILRETASALMEELSGSAMGNQITAPRKTDEEDS
jgi:hypothetical protein